MSPEDPRELPEPTEPTEPPPASPARPSARALRTMAIVRWILLGLVTALAAYTVFTFWGPEAREDSARGEDRYYCPMHPEIRSPDPGECPICHMYLEPIPEERRAAPAPDAHAGHAGGAPAPAEVTPVTLSPEKQRAIGVATSAVTSQSLGEQLRVPGVVAAPETGIAEVRVRAEGFVERVAVRQTGVRVTRGQTLAWIYSPAIYRAQEELLAATRWSASAAGAPGAGEADIAAAARRGLELLGLTRADIDGIVRAGEPLRAVPVRAPSAGYVTRFDAVLGSRAGPDRVLYEIADLSRVWVIASVHERDLSTLAPGTPARFTVSGRGATPIEARVELIEPVLDEATRTARVRLVVANRDGRLLPGQFGEVELALPATEGLFVPRDAVIRTGEHDYVYVALGDDRFEPRIVRTGLAHGGTVQILEGLSVGDRVVSRGGFMLDSESRLQASLAASPPPSSSGAASEELGPACDEAFDAARYPDAYQQCLACERQHAGMGRMVADCKNAIPRPWR